MDYRKIYNLETYLFGEVKKKFIDEGFVEPLDFYLILVWKSPRSKTRARDRLKGIAGSFSEAVRRISHSLYTAETPRNRLEILMTTWKFRLPTATAILTILYPTDFTVYDARVVDQLQEFNDIISMPFSERMWQEYLNYKQAVENNTPVGLSLRDKDRYLWGKSLYTQCVREIAL
jgi:hypothetical protein